MRGSNLSLNYVSIKERGLIKHYDTKIVHLFLLNKLNSIKVNYRKLEFYLSKPRLDRFLFATGHSKTRAQKLYRINLRVAQSFYPILNLIEIFFRNAINYNLSSHFDNPNWIITEKNGFMSHPTLKSSRFFLKNSVVKAEKSIRKRDGIITSGKVIAEQSFGFWTSLFDTHHYKLISGVVIQCFPSKPAHVNRKALNHKLNRVREFRNRVYHNEPICFKRNEIDFTRASEIKSDIYDLLNWIDADLTDFVKYFDGIDAKIKMINSL